MLKMVAVLKKMNVIELVPKTNVGLNAQPVPKTTVMGLDIVLNVPALLICHQVRRDVNRRYRFNRSSDRTIVSRRLVTSR